MLCCCKLGCADLQGGFEFACKGRCSVVDLRTKKVEQNDEVSAGGQKECGGWSLLPILHATAA
jgi:hypothetical protein